MTFKPLHPDEPDTSLEVVKSLIQNQFPQWAELPLVPVYSGGTANAIYRLGADKALRLPRTKAAIEQIDKERLWLPLLAPHLPLTIPVPLAKGEPDKSYPWPWSISHWIEGQNATLESLFNPLKSATELADFILALQGLDASQGPLAGEHNFGRGVPLAHRDKATRKAIEQLNGKIDTTTAVTAWKDTLNAPEWESEPVWLHGDLQSGNLLARNGQLTAVIDFGGLGVGDPACDLMVAWNLFTPEMRERFREILNVDEATWLRGKGWALSFGLIALPYYEVSNPILAEIASYAIDGVLQEYSASR